MHSQRKNTPNVTTFTFLLAVLLAAASCPVRSQVPQKISNKLILPENPYQIKFNWQGDSVNNSYEKHSAILVPVKLIGCPKTFYMQFDLGSTYSLFYKKKIESIKSKYLETAISITAAGAASAALKFGGMEIGATVISVRDFGSQEVDFHTRNPQIIGTLGVDLFDGKVLIIDYPEKNLTISPEMPNKYKKENNFQSLVYSQRSILLPTVIQGRKTMLFFDTGSSRYSLLTDEKTAKTLGAKNELPVTSKVSSWDRVLIANTISTDVNITIAGRELPIQKVTYMEGASSAQINMMMKMGIGGMTGNKLFLNYKLILDTKSKKFALIR